MDADTWAEMTSKERRDWELAVLSRELNDEREAWRFNLTAQAAYRQAEADRRQAEADRRQADEDIYDYR
jgi:hypothetical protein